MYNNEEKLEKDFNFFMKAFKAAAKRIKGDFFEIPVVGTETKFLRERAYCYELYHQLQIELNENFPYILHGELDKKGHPIIKEVIGEVIPDFVIHIPNTNNNLVVMEVKALRENSSIDLKKDLDKLEAFIEKIEYFRGIMLIYTNQPNEECPPQTVLTQFQEIADPNVKSRLLLVWHRGPRKTPLEISY